MADYLPTREAELLPFAATYSAKITLAPEDYGFIAADATALRAHSTAGSRRFCALIRGWIKTSRRRGNSRLLLKRR